MNIEQQRQAAQDETTSSERLRELATSDDSLTLENIVKNPNVPPDVLQDLAGQFFEQVFEISAKIFWGNFWIYFVSLLQVQHYQETKSTD